MTSAKLCSSIAKRFSSVNASGFMSKFFSLIPASGDRAARRFSDRRIGERGVLERLDALLKNVAHGQGFELLGKATQLA